MATVMLRQIAVPLQNRAQPTEARKKKKKCCCNNLFSPFFSSYFLCICFPKIKSCINKDMNPMQQYALVGCRWGIIFSTFDAKRQRVQRWCCPKTDGVPRTAAATLKPARNTAAAVTSSQYCVMLLLCSFYDRRKTQAHIHNFPGNFFYSPL